MPLKSISVLNLCTIKIQVWFFFSAESGRLMGQKDTGVETTYEKAQCETVTCQMDQRRHQDCRESLDAGRIGPVTLEIN